MPIIKQFVENFESHSDMPTTYAALLSHLNSLGFKVEVHESKPGEIVVQYLTRVADVLVWRCWSDKVLLKVNPKAAQHSQVEIYQVPNLLRIKKKKNEEVQDIKNLVNVVRTACVAL